MIIIGELKEKKNVAGVTEKNIRLFQCTTKWHGSLEGI